MTVSTTITVEAEGPASANPCFVHRQSADGDRRNAGDRDDHLARAGPTGVLVIVLGNKLPIDSTIPATVTVPAGASSVSFPITTNPVDLVTVEYTAANGQTLISAALNILPPTTSAPPPNQTSILTVTASGRNGVNVLSSPAGINVPTGQSGGASFVTGSAVTLSATGGRDVIWSGACASGGKKVKTCTFSISGTAAETASVQ